VVAAVLCGTAYSRADVAFGGDPRGRPIGGEWIGVTASRARHGVLAAWSKRHVRLGRDDGRSEWSGVIVARDRSEVLGVWSPARVRVSRDGGRRFVEQPLAGEIARAAFTRDGVLVTLSSSRIGSEPWAAWVESHRFADVADLDVDTLPAELEPADVALVDDRGAVQALAGDPCSCHGGVQGRWLGGAGAAMRAVDWPPGDCEAAAFGLGAGGWAYWLPKANDFDAEPRRIEAVGPDGAEHDVAGANGLHSGADFQIASNGSVTLALFGARLVRLRGAAMTVLDAHAPDGLTALAVDAAGRALALQGARILRFAPSGGWRALGSAP